MNCSLAWAHAPLTQHEAAMAAARTTLRIFMSVSFENSSMGERPQPQLLFSDGPELRKPVRLDDQEPDDQRPEHDELRVRNTRRRDRHADGRAERGQRLVQEDR